MLLIGGEAHIHLQVVHDKKQKYGILFAHQALRAWRCGQMQFRGHQFWVSGFFVDLNLQVVILCGPNTWSPVLHMLSGQSF